MPPRPRSLSASTRCSRSTWTRSSGRRCVCLPARRGPRWTPLLGLESTRLGIPVARRRSGNGDSGTPARPALQRLRTSAPLPAGAPSSAPGRSHNFFTGGPPASWWPERDSTQHHLERVVPVLMSLRSQETQPPDDRNENGSSPQPGTGVVTRKRTALFRGPGPGESGIGALPTRAPMTGLGCAELGWLAMLVPEDLGGLGATLEDIAILSEEMGRGLTRLRSSAERSCRPASSIAAIPANSGIRCCRPSHRIRFRSLFGINRSGATN